MKLHLNKLTKWAVAIISVFTLGVTSTVNAVYAEEAETENKNYSISMSPLNQKVILNAGEKYSGSFTVTNSVNNADEIKYNVSVQPFYVDSDYNIHYESTENLNQIVSWTSTDIESGTLPVGTSQKINFTVDVPKDAPAGGQYVAIVVSSVSDPDSKSNSGSVGAMMNQNIAMAHIVYAEIAGTTKHGGEIVAATVPSFLFDGEITGESTIKNTGNTHGTATYKMQIFPLFSNEEVYTTEENPETKIILPDRALTNKTSWKETPGFGIFNVVYTVEFEGVTTQVTKLVVKCPMWLLFIILFIIIAIIIAVVVRIRISKKRTPAEA